MPHGGARPGAGRKRKLLTPAQKAAAEQARAMYRGGSVTVSQVDLLIAQADAYLDGRDFDTVQAQADQALIYASRELDAAKIFAQRVALESAVEAMNSSNPNVAARARDAILRTISTSSVRVDVQQNTAVAPVTVVNAGQSRGIVAG